MAVVKNSDAAEINQKNSPLSPSKRKKRSKDPRIRVKGARIYDFENGKTCTTTLCHKCLLNRYGEKADEVGKLKNWISPRCRGACICSFCMKRNGCQPTGILSHTEKAIGFNSVHELIHAEGGGDLATPVAELTSTLKKSPLSNKGSPALKRNHDKENQCVEQNEVRSNKDGSEKKEKKKAAKRVKFNVDDETQSCIAAETRPTKSRKLKKDCSNKEHELTEANKMKCFDEKNDMAANQDKENVEAAKTMPLPKVHKPKKLANKDNIEPKKEDIVLPMGSPLTEIADIELPEQDIGALLQFLEFCHAFSERCWSRICKLCR